MKLPKRPCPVCGKEVALDNAGLIRPHGRNRLYGVLMGDGCPGVGADPDIDDEAMRLAVQRGKSPDG